MFPSLSRRSAIVLAVCVVPSWAAGQAQFLRGDSNHDKTIDVSDAVLNLLYLFAAPVALPCLDAADVDDTGEIDVTDAVALLGFIFTGGQPPAAPFPVFEADPTPDELSCLPEVPGPVTEGGSLISGDIGVDVTLVPDKTYRLVDEAYIKDGATLTIEAGVTILCETSPKAFLAVERGARIFAVGTATHPIVFTSEKPVGERRSGDWGGVLICGRAPANVEGGEWVVKGFETLRAGGGENPDPEESSGRVSYVRVEYAGGDVMGFPLTAITFCALGSGTQLDHIMAKYSRDDGLEWYGGTCSLKYGLSVGIEDDGVDCEYGWQGRGQFIACLQKPTAGNNGFQIAEDDGQPRLEPLTLPTLSNVSLLGAYASGSSSRSDTGLRVKRWAGVHFVNGIIQGWRRAGLRYDTDYGPVEADHSAFYDNGTDCTGSTENCAQLFEPPLENVVAEGSLVVDPEDLDAPDLRGVASRLPEPVDPTTIDPWFDPVSYVGAVPPEGEGDDWTQEPWISWLRE